MKTLTTTELRDRLASGPLALFDVRGDIEFEKGHIPGAKTAPLGSLVFGCALGGMVYVLTTRLFAWTLVMGFWRDFRGRR